VGKGAWRETGGQGGEEEEKGGEKKTIGKEKKTSLNSNLQKFTINIRVSKKNEFSPLFWDPASLQI